MNIPPSNQENKLINLKAIGISSPGRKAAYSKIIVKDILEESGVQFEMIHLAEHAEKNRLVEYGDDAQKEALAIGKLLNSFLDAS